MINITGKYTQANSAPHGAGRLFKRRECCLLSMDEYKQRMRGIYSTSVNVHTLDESPMAYKDHSKIIKAIDPICEVVDHLKHQDINKL